MSFSDEIFSRVEATINPKWKYHHESKFDDVLDETREAIGFEIVVVRKHYVLRGTLNQIVEANQKLTLCDIDTGALTNSSECEHTAKVKGASLPAVRSTGSDDLSAAVDEPKASSLKYVHVPVSSRDEFGSVSIGADAADDAAWDVPFSASLQTTANKVQLSAPDDLRVSGPSREIYADSEIWDYIEVMRKDQIRAIEDLGIAFQRVNENGITRVVICAKESTGTAVDVLNLAHDLLIELYEGTITNCVVEKCTCIIDEQVAYLRLEETNQRFRDVLARKCEYNDDFYFIGSRTEAYKAKQFFSMLVASDQGKGRPLRFDQHGQWYSLPYESMPYIDNLKLANAAKPNKSKGSGRGGDMDSPHPSVAGHGSSRVMADDEYSFRDSENMDSPAARGKPAAGLDRAREKDADGGRSIDNDRVDMDKRNRGRHGDDDDDRRGGNLPVPVGNLSDDDAVATAEERASAAHGDSTALPKQLDVGGGCRDGVQGRPMLDAEHKMIYNRDDIQPRITLIDASGVTVRACFRDADDAANSRGNCDRPDAEKQSKCKVKVTRRPMPKPGAAGGDPGVAMRAGAEAATPDAAAAAAAIDGIGNNDYQAVERVRHQAPDLARKSKPSEDVCVAFGTGTGTGAALRGPSSGKPSQRMPYDSDSSDDEQPRLTAKARGVNAGFRKPALKVHGRTPAKACRVRFEDRVALPAAIVKRDVASVRPGIQRYTDDWFVPSQAAGVSEELAVKIESLLAEGNPEDLDKLLNSIEGNQPISLPAATSVSRAVVGGKDEEASDNSAGDDKLETSVKPPQPSDGTFTQLVDKKVHLAGFEGSGTIMVTINFGAGVEESHPRKSYTQFDCNAYLPANGDGKRVCQLMEKAFNANKLFRVQYPGDAEIGSIVPNDVTLKTNRNSYPDASYLDQVRGQLETLLGSDADVD